MKPCKNHSYLHPQPPPPEVVWRSLRSQFLRKLLWPLVFAFFIAASFSAASNYREGMQQQAQWRQQTLDTFSAALIKPLWDCDDTTTRGIVQTLSQMPSVHSVRLQDLCASDTVEIGVIAEPQPAADQLTQAITLPRQLHTPLVYRDENNRLFTVGHLSLQFEPFSIMQTSSRGLGEQLLTFAATLLVMFTMVALVFRHTIERPLTRLHQAMQHQQTVHGTQPPSRKVHDELTDVTDVYDQLLQELQNQAKQDALTGLGNRKVLEQNLERAVHQASQSREGVNSYVLLLDLDGFKPINDTYGHAAGDFVLQNVAKRLREATRSSDTVTRLGGDEFVIIAHDYPGESGMSRILQRISAAVEAPQDFNGQTLHVGASIGYALIPPGGSSIETLLTQADQAMYAAKQARKRQAACTSDSGTPHT